MRIRPNIKALAAHHTEVNFRRIDPCHGVSINVHQARLAFDGFTLSRELVKRDAALFYGGNHWRHLIKVAREFLKSRTNDGVVQGWNRTFIRSYSVAVLRVG